MYGTKERRRGREKERKKEKKGAEEGGRNQMKEGAIGRKGEA